MVAYKKKLREQIDSRCPNTQIFLRAAGHLRVPSVFTYSPPKGAAHSAVYECRDVIQRHKRSHGSRATFPCAPTCRSGRVARKSRGCVRVAEAAASACLQSANSGLRAWANTAQTNASPASVSTRAGLQCRAGGWFLQAAVRRRVPLGRCSQERRPERYAIGARRALHGYS